ncbi:MAG: glucosidase, partial [Planctomycetaceae bacterium]
MTAEHARLDEAVQQKRPWKKWGPYLSERQWGTVREDYSEAGDAWNYFSHDQARSRAYRWGEDGLAGISDDQQRLCFALALWNGRDPILKERLFGLTNSESNHGEDVKEYYFYLDSTPTHSYMKYLYKYPQSAYPYDNLVMTSRKRGRLDFEYELIDTGVFDQDRYFDVFVEYAKGSPDDILIQITAWNRGPKSAELHLLPTLWFRNLWSWGAAGPPPKLQQLKSDGDFGGIEAVEQKLGTRYLYCEGSPQILFTENETNTQRIFGIPNRNPFVKDGINEYVVRGRKDAVNPEHVGTKAAPHYVRTIGAGESSVFRLRLSDLRFNVESPFGSEFDELLAERRREADEFYAEITPESLSDDEASVMRQALAGMLWTKQFYHYDVDKWLEERGADPFKPTRKTAPRNDQWHHMYNGDVISMPDKWEYPWYAAWDLAFHVIALTLVDSDFGKEQLRLMLRERYMHPNGQIPAYEWN